MVQYPSTTATGAPARPTIARPTIARPTIAGTSTGNTTATLKCIPTGYALSLSRMFDGVSRDEIKEYMVEMGVTPTYVSVLPKKWDSQLTRMAKVVVKQEDKETVMDPSFWPKSCVIREWFNKPRAPTTSASDQVAPTTPAAAIDSHVLAAMDGSFDDSK